MKTPCAATPWFRERGAALLIAVLLILAVAALGAIVAGSISGSDVTDSSVQGASVEALYAADSGVERALKQFSMGNSACGVAPCACGALPTTTHEVVAAGGRSFTPSAGVSKAFDGTTDLPQSQCRVQVMGKVAGTNVARTVQAILDRNLLAGSNPSFDSQWGTGAAPSLWTGTKFDYTGGPDPTGTPGSFTCRRAPYALHGRATGGSDASSTGFVAISPGFTVTQGQTVRVRFNVRVLRIGSSGSNACDTDAGVADPGGTNADAKIWFTIRDNAVVPITSVSAIRSEPMTDPGAPLNTRTVTAGAGCIATTQAFSGDYPSCASFYVMGTPINKRELSITVGGAPAGSTRTIVRLDYFIFQSKNRSFASEVWIDNIELIADTGAGVTRTAEWRDCAVSTCP
jgi:hypothetical protein